METTRDMNEKVSTIAEKGGEDNTAEATKLVHAHIRTNELEGLMAWISDNSWVLQYKV
jgi:hypothetical protein